MIDPLMTCIGVDPVQQQIDAAITGILPAAPFIKSTAIGMLRTVSEHLACFSKTGELPDDACHYGVGHPDYQLEVLLIRVFAHTFPELRDPKKSNILSASHQNAMRSIRDFVRARPPHELSETFGSLIDNLSAHAKLRAVQLENAPDCGAYKAVSEEFY